MKRLILVLSQDTRQLRETTDLLARLRYRFPQLMDKDKLLVLMNKFDLFFADEQMSLSDQTIEEICERIQVDRDRIIFCSAKVGLKARLCQANYSPVDEDTFDDLKTDIRKMPGIKKKLEKLKGDTLEVKVKQLSEIAEECSDVKKVEEHITCMFSQGSA